MGKRIRSQRRGRGTRRYISLKHRNLFPSKHKTYNKNELTEGKIISLSHSPAHSAPLVEILFESGERVFTIAPEKVSIGDKIIYGNTAPIKVGSTLPLSEIPEGTQVFNIEQNPGDGGKFVRSSGTGAIVLGKAGDKVIVRMPSKKQKTFNSGCRASIGLVAGGGRVDKPFLKAGKRWHAKRARGKLYPITSAVAMNAVNHPFGSGRGRHAGKPMTAPRFAPPGRKVGKVRARRTGKKR